MTAINQNVEMYAGDHLDIEVLVRTTSGDPVTPGGMTARYKAGSIIIKTLGAGVITSVENDTMLLTVRLVPEDTIDPTRWRKHLHEVDITDAAGNTFTVMTGILTVLPTLMPT